MTHDLFKTYSHKVKTLEELQKTIGPFPRNKKVIMCHGVFDVIHPGHLRHLIYAKTKADILIVSLTADCHINKGKYRPHVPEQLRALNMAAYELVDYVIIDRNSKPLKNLEELKPDLFCKGFEYSEDGKINPKTQEEMDVIEGYGGQIIFTPGDFVFSSSKFIEMSPPDIKYEKLSMLLGYENISFDDLRETINGFKDRKVHVLGDTIVDTFTRCEMIGGQTKTPTMSVLFQEKKDYVGGAAVVAKHLKAAGADVIFSTVLGEDTLKDYVLNDLKESGVDCKAYIDKLRPTTNKNAIIVRDYRMLKVDTLDNAQIPNNVLDGFIKDIKNTDAEAVIFSDFRHGIFNRHTIPELTKAIPPHMITAADSQVASRWGNITEFQGFDMITPNEREARFTLADQDSGIRPLASAIHEATNSKFVILKLGDRGVLCSKNHNHEDLDSFFLVDSFVDKLLDPVGAGDALLAYSLLSYLSSRSIVQSVVIGSIAAACECQFDGNIPITPEHVLEKLEQIEKNLAFIQDDQQMEAA